MRKFVLKPLIAGALTFLLALAPSFTRAQEEAYGEDYSETEVSGGDVLLDTVALRPLGLLATVLGTATFIVTLPFSALGGNAGEAAKTLVADPFAYTFQRPLGHND